MEDGGRGTGEAEETSRRRCWSAYQTTPLTSSERLRKVQGAPEVGKWSAN